MISGKVRASIHSRKNSINELLAPDQIPEELITEGANYWNCSLQKAASDPFTFNQALAELLKFSLVKRSAGTCMISIHRLVQIIIRDEIEKQEQNNLIIHVICAMNALFPAVDFNTWELCERYLPQALACEEWISQKGLVLLEGASLLNRTGGYLKERALYEKAEQLYQQTLAIRERQLGDTHPNTGNILNNLAALYDSQGRYSEAELLYQRALIIYQQQLGNTHLKTGGALNNLAVLYLKQEKYSEAEQLLQQALTIYQQQLGNTHLKTGGALNNLAVLYLKQEKYSEAEQLLQQALTISAQELGDNHPDTVSILNNLASLYQRQEMNHKAKPLLQRALEISKQQLGIEHPNTQILQENYVTLLALMKQEENAK